jgi:hypothetical protein
MVRGFFSGNTAAGVKQGMEDGGERGMGKSKGKQASGLASTIYTGAAVSSTKGLLDSLASGDVKGGVADFAKGLGQNVAAEVKQYLLMTLGKKILSGLLSFGGGGIMGGAGGAGKGISNSMKFASGGITRGGPIMVGERGREIVMPPAGSRILSAEETSAAMRPLFDFRGASLSLGGQSRQLDERTALEFGRMLEALIKRNMLPGLAAAIA